MSSSTVSINSNVASIRAQRKLSTSSQSLASSFEKLSAGLRITKASDDAAGLSMASALKADTRIYSQGVRNLNDGVSALNIADGALANLSSIVVRMQELAEQAANGSVSLTQRKSIDAEAQALAKEHYRISRTTDFNGLRLLDGSVQSFSLQAGYGGDGAITASLGGAMGTGTFAEAISYQTEGTEINALAIADLNGDGNLDFVTAGKSGGAGYGTIYWGNGNGTFRTGYSYEVEAVGSYAISLSDVNSDGIVDLLTSGVGSTDTGATIRLGNGDGSFRKGIYYSTGPWGSTSLTISDVNGDGNGDLVSTGTRLYGYPFGESTATIRLGNGDGGFAAAATYCILSNMPGAWNNDFALGDLNRDGAADMVACGPLGAQVLVGNGDGSFKAAMLLAGEECAVALSDLNSDGVLDLVTAGSNGKGLALISFGNGDGSFKAGVSYDMDKEASRALSLSDVNSDGLLDLVTAGYEAWGGPGSTTIRLGNGDGTFRVRLSYLTESYKSYAMSLDDLNADGVLDLVTAGDSENTGAGPGVATVRLGNVRAGVAPILPFSLQSQADARQALSLFEKTLERLSVQRGQMGAFQSRLSTALNTLGSTVLEYKGAQSRVEDVDVASESANLVRQQILQQAASGVLAQANQAPRLALVLLRG